MEKRNILDVGASKAKWRRWLAKNHDKEKEVWLVYYRKSSGKKRISYNDAVEEALSFGWIDSQVKGIDDERLAQRFSPRRKNSVLSEANKARIRKLIKEKKMTPAGLKAVEHAFDDDEKFVVAKDILGPLKKNKKAWKNYQKLPEDYKRVRIGFIESRRRHGQEAFDKSLAHFIEMSSKNKKFGIWKK